MKSLNRVFIMGHLGHPPQLKLSAAGKPYTRLNVATHRPMSREESASDGEEKQITDWHSVFVWGPQAERCVNQLRKGALVFVEGSLTYWQVAQNDNKQYKNAVHANTVKFLNQGKGGESEVELSNLDNSEAPPDHNAVAHPA